MNNIVQVSELPNVVLDHLVEVEGWSHMDYIGTPPSPYERYANICNNVYTCQFEQLYLMYLPEFCIFSCYGGGPSGVQTHIEPAIQVLVKIYFINKNM